LALIRERDRVRRRVRRVSDAATVRQTTGLDLAKLHHSLFSLERELAGLTSAGRTRSIIRPVSQSDTLVKISGQTVATD